MTIYNESNASMLRLDVLIFITLNLLKTGFI